MNRTERASRLSVKVRLKTMLGEFRSVAQLVEHRSPKPVVVGSSPSAPARFEGVC